MINPFIIAASPATQGVKAVLKSAQALPGAISMRNFGHGAGGGSLTAPSGEAMRNGEPAIQIHALGTQIKDMFNSLEEYCEGVYAVRRQMPSDVKLWVSVGHFSDIAGGKDWQSDWPRQAVELERAGADALELHFNTPGVAVAVGQVIDFYQAIEIATTIVKKVVRTPVMVKLPVEACHPLRAMQTAVAAGADGIGPTARWKGFVFDLDWRRSEARPGGGYGGTQALPVACYTVAEARLAGITTPMYAGGGVFSWEAAAKLIMAGSDAVQLGSLACCLGPGAVSDLIKGFSDWMEHSRHASVGELRGEALQLFTMPAEAAAARVRQVAQAYRAATVDANLCNGCGHCADACWYDSIDMVGGIAEKLRSCIGCGYCFQVCPTGALHVDASDILARS